MNLVTIVIYFEPFDLRWIVLRFSFLKKNIELIVRMCVSTSFHIISDLRNCKLYNDSIMIAIILENQIYAPSREAAME